MVEVEQRLRLGADARHERGIAGCTRFTATIRPAELSCRARHTEPIAPAPMRSTSL